jgi:hypothetical protein
MLGRQQIAGVPTAVSELFKNAHDAYAERVEVDLFRSDKLFVLRDDGVGMGRQDFEDRWLTLGTDSKVKDMGVKSIEPPPGMVERPILGEKGIGRLAIAAIGPTLLILTRPYRPANAPLVCALVDWGVFALSGVNLSDAEIPILELKRGRLPDLTDVRSLVEELEAGIRSLGRQAGAANIRPILERLERFDVDPCLLAEQLPGPALAGGGHGTQFYIQPVDEGVFAAIDESTGRDMPPPLERTLIGFSNTMLPDRPAPRILTSFRDRRQDGEIDELLAGERFFTKEEFAEADHRIVGRFDKYGKFTGKIDIYGEDTIDYELPWAGRPNASLDCGPFTISVAVVQGERAASRLDAESYAVLNDKLKRIGGLYIYRDAIRVLPYGNQDFDWIGLERSRSEHAGRAYFSYRRMFGVVEIDHVHNSNLVEKAGREGLRENRAYREFRGVTSDFFRHVALDVFVSGGRASETFLVAKKQRDRRAKAKAELERQSQERRQQFEEDLDRAYEFIAGGAAGEELQGIVERLDMALSAATRSKGGAEKLFIEAELAARQELVGLLSKCRVAEPAGLALTADLRRDYEELQTRIASFQSGPFSETSAQIAAVVDARSVELQGAPNQRLRLERLVHEGVDHARTEVARYVGDLTLALDQIDRAVETLAASTSSDVDRSLTAIVEAAARLDVEGMPSALLAERLSAIDEELADLLERETYILGTASSVLQSLDFRRNDGDLTLTDLEGMSALEEELLILRERSDEELELAQLGMAVEVISHEFGGTVRSLRRNLRRLKAWADVNPDLGPLYTDLRTSFEHLDGYLTLFTPLQRRLRRTKTHFRGAELHRFLMDLFDERLKRDEVDLEATSAFLDHELVGFRSTYYPVFVNLVDNAIYWTRPSRRMGHKGRGLISDRLSGRPGEGGCRPAAVSVHGSEMWIPRVAPNGCASFFAGLRMPTSRSLNLPFLFHLGPILSRSLLALTPIKWPRLTLLRRRGVGWSS